MEEIKSVFCKKKENRLYKCLVWLLVPLFKFYNFSVTILLQNILKFILVQTHTIELHLEWNNSDVNSNWLTEKMFFFCGELDTFKENSMWKSTNGYWASKRDLASLDGFGCPLRCLRSSLWYPSTLDKLLYTNSGTYLLKEKRFHSLHIITICIWFPCGL